MPHECSCREKLTRHEKPKCQGGCRQDKTAEPILRSSALPNWGHGEGTCLRFSCWKVETWLRGQFGIWVQCSLETVAKRMLCSGLGATLVGLFLGYASLLCIDSEGGDRGLAAAAAGGWWEQHLGRGLWLLQSFPCADASGKVGA